MITASQWKRVVKTVLPEGPDWGFKGKLTFQRPVGWVLLGVLGEGSGFQRDQVYVWFLSSVLFVPRDSVPLDHGDRVPNGTSTFGLDHEDRLKDALRLAFERIPTEREALERIARTPTEEARYALVLLGREDEAERALSKPFGQSVEYQHVIDARERQAEILRLLQSEGRDAALAQLSAWRDHTLTAEGLEQVP